MGTKSSSFYDDKMYAKSVEPAFDAYYQSLDWVKSFERCEDRKRQLQGLDVILTLQDGTTLTVDEKISREAAKTGNLFWEEWQCTENQLEGWGRTGKNDVLFYGMANPDGTITGYWCGMEDLRTFFAGKPQNVRVVKAGPFEYNRNGTTWMRYPEGYLVKLQALANCGLASVIPSIGPVDSTANATVSSPAQAEGSS